MHENVWVINKSIWELGKMKQSKFFKKGLILGEK